MNANNIHSTDIDREQREVNDPAFTLYTQRSFAIAVGIGFFLSIGLIFIGVHYGENIDDFLKTKTGLIVWLVIFNAPWIAWAIWRIKKMF